MSWTNDPGTPSRSIGADERRRSSLAFASGGSSIGEGPLCGERPATDDPQSEMSDGAPSAESCEKADGEGSGVSIILPNAMWLGTLM